MKPTTLHPLLCVGTTLVSTTSAISLHKRQDAAPRVIGLQLQRNQIADPVAYDRNRNRLRKRQSDTVEVTIDNLATLYYFNTSIGTPPQDIRVHLDTGSSDLWVNSPDSRLCSMQSNPCETAGTYTANSSSTYEYLASNFNISYVDGSGASGDYVTDTMHLDGMELEAFQFGVGYTSSSSQGILGIGYPSNEVQVARNELSPYDNLPAKLAAEGHIASNAFSMWLNSLDAPSGSLLFGGVNRAHYRGDLISVPIERVDDEFSEFYVTLTKVSLGSTTVEEDMALAVLIDSGSTLTYLPNDMVASIYNMTNAVYEETEGVAFVPCALGEQSVNMTFTFSEPASIAVPLNELVVDFKDLTGRQLSFSNGVPACLFGIAPALDSTNVLGDTFLRSAYVVYDLDNNEISLAQTVFNATRSDIVEIGTGPDAVPAADIVDDPVAAASGIPSDSGAGTVSSSILRTIAVGSAAMLAGIVGV